MISRFRYHVLTLLILLFVPWLAISADNAGSPDAITAEKPDTSIEIYAEQWDLSRTGDRMLGIEGLRQAVNQWSADTSQVIELRYPGGEEGDLWVSQLSDWLVALGVPSSNLNTVPGSGSGDIIRIQVIRTGR